MPDIPISALPSADALAPADIFPVVQAGVTKRASVAQLPSGGGGSAFASAIDLRFIAGFDQTGATSISAALNTAISQAAGSGALKAVFVPAATTPAAYPVSGPVTLKDGVTVGFGEGAKVKLAAGFTGDAFTAATLTGARLRGLVLDGNASAAPGAGSLVSVTGSGSDLVLSGLRLSNAAGNGVTLNAVADAQLLDTKVDGTFFGINAVGCPNITLRTVKVTNSKSYIDNHVAGIYLMDCDHGLLRDVDSSFNLGHGLYLGNSDYFTVLDSEFHDNGSLTTTGFTDEGWRRGMTLSSANPNSHFTMRNVRLYNNIENGILASSGNTYLVATNCRAWNNNLQNAPGGHGFELNGQYTTVTGCYAWNNNGGFSHNGSNLTITNSYAWANTQGGTPTGFKFYNGSSQKVLGCQAWGQDVGFDFNGDTGRVLAGVTVVGCESYGNTTYGLALSADVDGTTLFLDDNYLHGNGTKDLNNQAPGYFDQAAAFRAGAGSSIDSSTVGNYFGFLAGQHETMPRFSITTTSLNLASGSARFAFFTARTTQLPVGIRVVSGTTAAGATPSLVKFALYSVDGSGAMTQLAVTNSDPAVFAAASTVYARPFNVTPAFRLTVGARYAIGMLVVTAAATPTITGTAPGGFANEMAVNPIVVGTLGGQTDLPASTSVSALGTTSGLPYAVLY